MEKIKRELIYSLEKLKFFLSSNDIINVGCRVAIDKRALDLWVEKITKEHRTIG